VRQEVGNAAENARQAAADAALAGKVKTALETRKGLEAPKPHLDVNAKDGHVVLKGDVSSREQAELAERVALETEGVNSVDNQLMLRVPAKGPGTPPTTPGGTGTTTPIR
jgi:osmotically-inducible protein OsmY